MDSFEYLIALVSVIAGLGITRTLSGIARLIDARDRVTFSWIPFCWTASALLWLVAFWWFTFLLSSLDSWSPFLYIFVLIYAGFIFFLLALLHPETIAEGHDMLQHLLDNRKMFFGTLMVVGILDVVDTWIKVELGIAENAAGMTGQESVDLPRKERDGTPGLARLEYTRKLLAHWFVQHVAIFVFSAVKNLSCDVRSVRPRYQILVLWDMSQGQYWPERATVC